MKLVLGSWCLFLLGRSLARRISISFATALYGKVALSVSLAAFFPVERALFGTMFAPTSRAVLLLLSASITESLGPLAERLLLLSELLCPFSFSQVVVLSNFFHFAYVRLSLYLSSGGVENTAGVCIFG